MAKRPTPEQVLDELAAVRRDPGAAEARERLLTSLASSWNIAVAKAAAIIAEHRLAGYGAALAASFDRLMQDPAKRDPQCSGMIAIVQALHDTAAVDSVATGVFLRGLPHRQFDGPLERGRVTDSAGPLRGHCGLALLDARHPDAFVELVKLLVDPELAARVAGARGLSATGREEAAWVLLLKLLSGSKVGEEPEVLGECMSGLLRLDPRRALPLIGTFLADETRTGCWDAAAIALGESRRPEALPLLKSCLDRAQGDQEWQGIVLTSIAMLRSAEAAEVLVSIVESAPLAAAAKAIEALGLYRRDEALRTRMSQIVQQRNEVLLSRAFDKTFGA